MVVEVELVMIVDELVVSVVTTATTTTTTGGGIGVLGVSGITLLSRSANWLKRRSTVLIYASMRTRHSSGSLSRCKLGDSGLLKCQEFRRLRLPVIRHFGIWLRLATCAKRLKTVRISVSVAKIVRRLGMLARHIHERMHSLAARSFRFRFGRETKGRAGVCKTYHARLMYQ